MDPALPWVTVGPQEHLCPSPSLQVLGLLVASQCLWLCAVGGNDGPGGTDTGDEGLHPSAYELGPHAVTGVSWANRDRQISLKWLTPK